MRACALRDCQTKLRAVGYRQLHQDTASFFLSACIMAAEGSSEVASGSSTGSDPIPNMKAILKESLREFLHEDPSFLRQPACGSHGKFARSYIIVRLLGRPI